MESTLDYQRVLEQQIHSLAPYEELYQQVAEINQIASQVKAGRVNWENSLSQLAFHLPHGVWLSDFNGSFPREGEENAVLTGEIRLRGWASQHLLVAQLLDELKLIPELRDIHCLFSTVSGQPEGNTQFEITAKIATQGEKKENSPGGSS